LTAASTARLLEPWLGEGFDMDELPVPRLVIVTIDEDRAAGFCRDPAEPCRGCSRRHAWTITAPGPTG
jgi:cell division protein FtsX